jgi:hypothetical protein
MAHDLTARFIIPSEFTVDEGIEAVLSPSEDFNPSTGGKASSEA